MQPRLFRAEERFSLKLPELCFKFQMNANEWSTVQFLRPYSLHFCRAGYYGSSDATTSSMWTSTCNATARQVTGSSSAFWAADSRVTLEAAQTPPIPPTEVSGLGCGSSIFSTCISAAVAPQHHQYIQGFALICFGLNFLSCPCVSQLQVVSFLCDFSPLAFPPSLCKYFYSSPSCIYLSCDTFCPLFSNGTGMAGLLAAQAD